MKILILQDFLRNGGTERQSCLLANAFSEAGHAVALLTFRPGGALEAMPSPRVERLVLQSRDRGWDWFAPRLTRTAQTCGPDVILCMGRMANCYGERLAVAIPEARVIATVRTGKPLPWLFRRSLRRAAHVVANSEESRRILVSVHGIAEVRTSVIHNALVFPPETTEAPATGATGHAPRLRVDPGENGFVMLCVGMFRPEKNQRELIEMANLLPREVSWQLWFAGEGATRVECEQFVERLGLSERIRFFGFQENPSDLYRAADLAVLASTSESLSNFLIEAHAHGLPSVSYEVTGVYECGGIVVPRGDRKGFLAQVRRFIADRPALEAESRRVATHALEHFSPQRQTAAYLDLFARLCLPAPSP
ncbi:MAG: glycosyltransferase [Opitutaceae bacterium]|nr:glycosyltransferase [Opitutaceae bacterium]